MVKNNKELHVTIVKKCPQDLMAVEVGKDSPGQRKTQFRALDFIAAKKYPVKTSRFHPMHHQSEAKDTTLKTSRSRERSVRRRLPCIHEDSHENSESDDAQEELVENSDNERWVGPIIEAETRRRNAMKVAKERKQEQRFHKKQSLDTNRVIRQICGAKQSKANVKKASKQDEKPHNLKNHPSRINKMRRHNDNAGHNNPNAQRMVFWNASVEEENVKQELSSDHEYNDAFS